MSQEKLQQTQESIETTSQNSLPAENQVQENLTPAEKEYSDIEKRAMEMGWDPNHQGRTFVEASEYVNRAPLFERIERQSREIKELKDLVRQSTSHLTSIRKDSYEQAIRDLENKRMVAVDQGDQAAFMAAEAQANALRVKMRDDPALNMQSSPQIDPEVLNFAERNQTWYNTATLENKKMMAAAQDIDNFLVKQANLDNRTINPTEHLKMVEAEIKRLFPHRFENIKRNSAPVVGKSTLAGHSTISGLASKLSPTQLALGKEFNKSNPKYTLELYAADLEKMGRLGK